MKNDLNVVRINIYMPYLDLDCRPTDLEKRIRPKKYKDEAWIPMGACDSVLQYYLFESESEAKEYVEYLKDNFQNEKSIEHKILAEQEFGRVW